MGIGALLLIVGFALLAMYYPTVQNLQTGLGQLGRILDPSLNQQYRQALMFSYVGGFVGLTGFILLIVGAALSGSSAIQTTSSPTVLQQQESDKPGRETVLDSDENAILEGECRFITPDDDWKDGTLFLTDQDRIVFVIHEDRVDVRDHNYQISSVTNVRVDNKSDNPILAIDWKYDDQISFEELTYRYESLDNPEKWKRKILKIKDTTSPTSHRRKAKGTSKSAKQFCISCGSALPKGSKYCNKCGTQQPS